MNRPPFEGRPWHRDPAWTDFRVGKCYGLFQAAGREYHILALKSEEPGNGDFDHALGYFFTSCKRDHMDLCIMEVMNKGLGGHLLGGRDFIPVYGLPNCLKLEYHRMP